MAIVETLETRRLFSFDFPTAAQLAQSLNTLKGDEAAATAGAKALQGIATKDAALLKNDLNHLGVAKTQKSLLTTATAATQSLMAKLSKSIKTDDSVISKEVARLVADEKKLAKKPTSAALQNKVLADSSVITNSSNADFTTLYDDRLAGANLGTNFDAIASANPSSAQVAADVNKTKTDLSGALSKTEGAFQSVIAADTVDVQSLYGLF